MDSKIKYILFGIISIIIILLIVIPQIKCNSLRNELNAERIKNLEQIDSLTYINREHEKLIKTYELQISEMETKVDSLKRLKNRVIIKKDEVIVSKDVSSAVNQLKSNLEKWKE